MSETKTGIEAVIDIGETAIGPEGFISLRVVCWDCRRVYAPSINKELILDQPGIVAAVINHGHQHDERRQTACSTKFTGTVKMPEPIYRARVHIASTHDGQIQKCFRCDRILTDGRNTMEPIGGVEFLPWEPGAFVGITERVDGRPISPAVSYLMDHDAAEADEVRCDA